MRQIMKEVNHEYLDRQMANDREFDATKTTKSQK